MFSLWPAASSHKETCQDVLVRYGKDPLSYADRGGVEAGTSR